MSGVISEKQKQLNQELHKSNKNFGNRATGAGIAQNLPTALNRMHELGVCNSFLDYGTGKGLLVQRLKKLVNPKINVTGYDPSVAEYSVHPEGKYDIVSCLDVLEHVELDSIDSVIDDIANLTKRFCYVVVDLQPAVKTMSDGRNAHILLAPSDWWINKFSQRFKSLSCFPVMHACGQPQKIVLAATNNLKMSSYMYMFLLKMNVFNIELNGGVLAKMAAGH